MSPTQFLICRVVPLLVALTLLTSGPQPAASPADSPPDSPANARKPASRDELRYWLENMVWRHQFNVEEIVAATGLPAAELVTALREFQISPETAPPHDADGPLLVIPYPGGRHPRIGFLEGAIDPQRETKFSVFTPWDRASYVVVDAPEAIWSNLGLTYLAHSHIPTIWTKAEIELERLEWTRHANGELSCERRLPNGITFGTRVVPQKHSVVMEMWLRNDTRETLTDLRVQNCVMLKGAAGFQEQINENKVFRAPYAAARSMQGDRWVITAWEPCHRPWGNAACPCLHSDPKFPDCPPGETRRLRGWLSFYTGTEIDDELNRIDATAWRTMELPARDE
ncbi:MAG: hypothetical protein EHM42_07170 [Planctomycetaceae bacterium]|nr:MAG: hypothetical protein EHM42_07170 [Planctomycetaceae bacterium]